MKELVVLLEDMGSQKIKTYIQKRWSTNPIRLGLTNRRSTTLMSHSFKYTRLSKDEAACLLVDHQGRRAQ